MTPRRRSDDRAKSLEQLLAAKEIVIGCGSGGVGKTTTAAAAAAMAATSLGGKVLVLTVDPARRLANALGLEGFGNVEKLVPAEAFKQAGVDLRGELWAAMLDTKQSWDAIINLHAPDKETDAASSRTRCTRTCRAASCRATTTSPWSGCTRSTPPATTT